MFAPLQSLIVLQIQWLYASVALYQDWLHLCQNAGMMPAPAYGGDVAVPHSLLKPGSCIGPADLKA